MNENRQVLEHLENLIGTPMNLLVYIERVVESDIFQSVYSFHDMSDAEILKLEELALPESVTKGFCKSLRSIKGGGTMKDFLQKDIDDLRDDNDDDLCDDDSLKTKIEVYGMKLPDISKTKRMSGIEKKDGDHFYTYKDGSVLLIRPFVCTGEITSEVILDNVRESISNMGVMSVAALCKLYQEIAKLVNQLSFVGDMREYDYAEIADIILTQIESKCDIPYKD